MSWNAKYVVFILFTTVVSYIAARLLERFENKIKKKLIIVGTALMCLGILFFFKYFNFMSTSVVRFLNLFAIKLNPVTVNLLLPVGISFYTFQTLSYVIDVYRGTTKAEHHFGRYATFISFFPQLVAGPIERTNNLLSQIKEEKKFDYAQGSYGIKLMVWGFFKKIVIADNLSLYVSRIYNAPGEYSGFVFVLATIFFAFQIYCDFSGYSDIAIGTSKLLGINLMTNFKSPYFSQSIKEFWGRWHISLSTWFRDYVYIPLGGNRVGKVRYALNLLITFLMSGLWHGASWTFVIWGTIHGIAQIIENLFLPNKYKNSTGLVRFIRILFVFLFSCFTWIFFVSNSLSDSLFVIMNMFDNISNFGTYINKGIVDIGITMSNLCGLLFGILVLMLYDGFSLKTDCIEWISNKHVVIRYTAYLLMLCVLLFYRATVQAEFVYFQF